MKKMRLRLKWGNQIHIGRGILRILLLVLCVMAVFSVFWEFYQDFHREEAQDNPGLQSWLEQSVMDIWMPGTSALWAGYKNNTYNLLDRMVLENFPVLLFSMEYPEEYDSLAQGESDYEELLILEGSDENRKEIAEGSLEYEEDAIHLDKGLENAFLTENEQAAGETAPGEKEDGNAGTENNTVNAVFHEVEEPVYRYQWDTLQSYEDLVKAFYAIDSTTTAGQELLNLEKLLSKDMRMQGSNDMPQILIYHTHSQEAFVDSIEGDESTTIVGAGEKLTQLLRDKYGYHVIHYTESFDKESRDYSYSDALPAIEKLLSENPSIELVIDLHRDAMPADKRLVVDLQGRPTAQYMFFNGLSRTAKNGAIESLENPYLDDNLALSLQMQTASNEYYPGIARRIYLKAYRYNMHLRPKSLLIELGAQTNTVEEIMNAIDPLAHVIHLVLSGEEPDRDF
ncbi:MAG: stage II sporulation protein P [Blautia sp.]|nr:stage II sporulation protein P [Lachnoclostridium sp.]MCM1210414.1 stage II sporulation protein P [Blautia sp.]